MPNAAVLTSTASDRVKAVRALHERAGRRRSGTFLVEGPQAVAAALTADTTPVREVFVDTGGERFAATATARGIRVTHVAPRVLAAMAETEHPQGVLAVCDLLPSADLDTIMARPGPVVVLDGVGDPGNVGTIIRTASAGSAGVVLTAGCADVHNGKVVRGTAGALFDIAISSGHDVGSVLRAARVAGRTVAVTAGEGADDLFDLLDAGRVGADTCWVIGSEAHGVSRAARDGADEVVRIPMAPGPQSLNAAVAAAVVLYVTAYATRPTPSRDERLTP